MIHDTIILCFVIHLFKLFLFVEINYNIIKSFSYLFFPPSKSSHIYLFALIKTDDCFLLVWHAYMYIALNTTCSVCIMVLVCIFSELRTWHWTTTWCDFFPKKKHGFCSQHSLVACSLGVELRSCCLYQVHFGNFCPSLAHVILGGIYWYSFLLTEVS